MNTTTATQKNIWAGKKQRHKRQTKRMNCSPAVKKHAIPDSCYTPKILLMIRDAYNKDHSAEERITESDPTKLWQILNDRLVQCKKEDCWLNELDDPNLKKRIDRYIFAPDKPYEWKRNPNEWLSNYDILNVLEQYEIQYPAFEFIGPSPIDFDTHLPHSGTGQKCVWNELCHFSLKEKLARGKRKIGIVFNLDKHTQSGSHWVSLFVDMTRKFVFYFDSAGGKMPPEIATLIRRIQTQAEGMGIHLKEYANGSHTHQYENTECGMYSLFFIILLLTGRPSHRGKRMSLRRILHLLLKERISDKEIEKYRDEYFNAGG
jgi:hypothetical protein